MQEQEKNIKAAADTQVEKLYDLSMIEQLCRGNQDQVKRMVTVFIEQTGPAVNEIKSAYAQRDFMSIKKNAHKIKPTITYYGIASLEKNIRAIEIMAEAKLLAELRSPIDKLDEVLTKAIEQMKKDFLL